MGARARRRPGTGSSVTLGGGAPPEVRAMNEPCSSLGDYTPCLIALSTKCQRVAYLDRRGCLVVESHRKTFKWFAVRATPQPPRAAACWRDNGEPSRR